MTLCVLLLVLVFPVVPPFSSAETTDELVKLEAGSSVRRELAPGARDIFGVAAQQGEVLQLSLHKGDLTVSAVLYGPKGTKVLEHFSQDFEVLEISFPVEDTGAYRIEIQLQENGETRRNYELKLHSSKSIATRDRMHWEAQRAFAEAEVLRATWTRDSLRQSIDSFGAAARRWTEIGEFANASRSSLKSGDVCFLLSDYQRAFERFQNALVLARKAGDPVGQARALTQLGHLSSYRGDNDSAQHHLNRALDLLGPVEDGPDAIARNAFGDAVSILAEVLYAKGNLDRSMAQFERAGRILHDDRKGRARTHLFSGYIAGSLGSPDKAVSEISRALELSREIRNKSGEGLALTALGLFNSFLKNDDKAIQLHRTAIDIFRSIGDRSSEGIALNALGQSYESRKEYTVALEHYQQALRLFQDQGVLDFASVTLFKVAKAFQLMGKFDQPPVSSEESPAYDRDPRNIRVLS
jgi:tetratricopeptide (TPR) repeat protein